MTRSNSIIEAKQRAVWEKPKVGDLVMVRDIERDKSHGRKLDARWLPPRLWTEISSSEVAGYVKDFYNDQIKEYHLDALKVYCSREENVTVPRNAMALAGFPGQRAVDLHQIGW